MSTEMDMRLSAALAWHGTDAAGSRMSKSRGSALLTVLWLTAALSAIGLAVANNVRGETERAATNMDDAKSYFVSRGAIQRAALHVMWRGYATPDGRPLYYIPGNPSMDLSFPEAEVHVDIIPETSKLNVNSARPEELLLLLTALGLPEDRGTTIAAAIADWRSPADPLRPSPFDAFYLSQSPSFSARHSSFLENEELLLVQGITPDLYYGSSLDNARPGLRDCLTVYGATGSVDINTAQAATLQAVGIPAASAANIVKSRAQHPILDFRELAALQQSLGPAGFRLRIGGQTIFTLRATARMKRPDGSLSDMRRTTGALVKFNFPGNRENKAPGFEVLRWYDRI
jgi:general secretion pathway protein K